MDRPSEPPAIRRASLDDYDAINRIAAESDVQMDPPEGPGRPYVERLLDDGTVLVAERAARVVGFAAAVWIRPAPGSDALRRSHVSDLFVEQSAQGSGVGGPLYRALLEAHAEARWSVSSSNDPRAQALYEKGGMAPAWPIYYLERPPQQSGRPLRAPANVHVRELTPLEATASVAALSGFDRRLDVRTWSSRRGSIAFAVEVDGDVALVGFARDHSHRAGRWLDAAFIAEDADPAAALQAALAAEVLTIPGATLGLALGAPHPATWPLLGAGFQIAELDRWFETPLGLVDPALIVPDPSVG